jgi:hypothetical protein
MGHMVPIATLRPLSLQRRFVVVSPNPQSADPTRYYSLIIDGAVLCRGLRASTSVPIPAINTSISVFSGLNRP